MIVAETGCIRFDPTPLPIELARVEIMADFGPWSLLATPNPRRPIGEKPMPIPSRPQLRKLAQAAKVLETGPTAFSTKAEALVEMLTPLYPSIAEMSDEDIDAAIAELKEGGGEEAAPAKVKAGPAKTAVAAGPAKAGPTKPGPAKPGPAKAGPKPAAKEEPVVEDEPVVEEDEVPAEKEEKAKPGPSKPAGTKPGPAKPGPAAAKTVAAPAKTEAKVAEAPKVDLKPLFDRIDAIGDLTDANKGSLIELSGKVDAIIGYLTFQYNQGRLALDADGNLVPGEVDPIKSITEIDWS